MQKELTPQNNEVAAIWSDFLRDLSRSAELASTRLRALSEGDEPDAAPEVRSRWGRKALRLEGLGLEWGMTTKEISTAIDLNDEPNADKVMAGLERDGQVERVPDASPKRWRLDREHRRDRILRVSRLVPPGRWTTYGDIAIVTSGNIRTARAVSRVAAKNAAFANPHRVLEKAGTIPAGWRSDDGLGPEECRRRLAAEGITLTDGKAPRELRINHEELQERLSEREAAEDGGAAG